MNPGWYYSKPGAPEGRRVGPVSWDQLIAWAQSGALSPDDLVWNERLPDWRPARDIPGLYFVGQATYPGIGMPMVLLSARLLAERLAEERKG